MLKVSAASPHLLTHRGQALVFNRVEEYNAVCNDPALPVTAETVLIVRNAGPKGYPGFPEIGNLEMPRVVGMANSPVLAPDEVTRRRRHRVDLLSDELGRLRLRRAEQEPLPEHVQAIFAYGEALLLADLGWAEQLLQRGKDMDKYDLKAARRELYAPSANDFSIVDVPAMKYLALDGSGNPNSSDEYVAAVEALYTVAYTVKAHSRTTLGRDFVVPPLEGLWWADDMTAFTRRDKSAWRWTMLIALPDWITADQVVTARTAARAKKDLPAIDAVAVRTLNEGRSVQILHVGSYDDEGPVLARLHETYLPDHGLVPNGQHHEIYLSDARRTQPAKLRTILRQPVKPARKPGGRRSPS